MIHHYLLKVTTCLFISCLLISSTLFAQTIKGKIIDAANGEPLFGAVVKLKKDSKVLSTQVNLDGSYAFKNIPEGNYTFNVKLIGYDATQSEEVTATKNKVTVLNKKLSTASSQLGEVSVKSSVNKESDQAARLLEKNADVVQNILSARYIEISPDVTVANSLQRMSGVTVEKGNSGEARYPIIRGMEKRYINTLINGIKIPSPDNKSRFIPLDLFPSDLLERLEVTKTLIPSMEADAIGGTINLVMKDAPEKRILNVNAATGFNDILSNRPFIQFNQKQINKKSPNERNGAGYGANSTTDFPLGNLYFSEKPNPYNALAGITYGDRFGKRKQFGIITSASFQNTYSGTNNDVFLPNYQPTYNNVPQFVDLEYRRYSTQNRRLGLNAKLDYRLNNANKFSWANTYIKLDMFQSRFISDTVSSVNSVIDDYRRSTWQYQSIYASTLKGEHQLLSSLKLDWSLVYSVANNHIPDQAEFYHEYPVSKSSTTPDQVGKMTRRWTHNSDQDYTAYLNLTKESTLFKRKIEYKIGGLARSKNRDNFYNAYSLSPLLTGGLPQVYTSITNTVFIFKGTGSNLPEQSGNNYTFDETNIHGYAQVKWQLLSKLEAIGGFRVEYTRQHYNTAIPKTENSVLGTIHYTDVLPSVSLKYLLNAKSKLRFSYYQAVARPAYSELIPDGYQGENFKEQGNPDSLKHTLADNFDLRYELFPGKADQLLIGVFYKNIKDPIEYSTVNPPSSNSLLLIPNNWGTCSNYGFELDYTKYFGKFGVTANYTYTQSKIKSNKIYKYRSSTGSTAFRFDYSETRPLQGQSNHIGNLSALYKDPKIGLDIQAAFVYTGERISLVSPYAGLSYWQAPLTQIDLSFEKRIIKKLAVYGKINNLTNESNRFELHKSYTTYIATPGSKPLALQTDPNNKIVVQRDFYKTNYLLGFRYKF